MAVRQTVNLLVVGSNPTESACYPITSIHAPHRKREVLTSTSLFHFYETFSYLLRTIAVFNIGENMSDKKVRQMLVSKDVIGKLAKISLNDFSKYTIGASEDEAVPLISSKDYLRVVSFCMVQYKDFFLMLEMKNPSSLSDQKFNREKPKYRRSCVIAGEIGYPEELRVVGSDDKTILEEEVGPGWFHSDAFRILKNWIYLPEITIKDWYTLAFSGFGNFLAKDENRVIGLLYILNAKKMVAMHNKKMGIGCKWCTFGALKHNISDYDGGSSWSKLIIDGLDGVNLRTLPIVEPEEDIILPAVVITGEKKL